MKKLSVKIKVEFLDDSRNLSHQTNTENELVKIIQDFKAKLNTISGVTYVFIDAHVRQAEITTPERSGIAALGGKGSTGPNSILPYVRKKIEPLAECETCGSLLTTFGCTEIACNYKGAS